MNIAIFTFNPFQENTYIIYDETNNAAIIDPGCSNKEEQDNLISFIEEKKLNILLDT